MLKVLRELQKTTTGGISGAEIARATGLASGTLYPLLFRLERTGWVWSEWEEVIPAEIRRPRRRLYRLTEVGGSATRDVLSEYLPAAEEMTEHQSSTHSPASEIYVPAL